MMLLVNGHLLHLRFHLWHPRWIHNRQRLDADFRRRQRELYTRWRYFERQVGALFHSWPNLVSQLPQHLEPQYGVYAHAGAVVPEAVVHQLAGLIRGAYRRHYEKGRSGSGNLLVRLEQELPSDRQNVHEQLLRHHNRPLHQRGERRVKHVLHLGPQVPQDSRILFVRLPYTRLLRRLLPLFRILIGQVFGRVSLGEPARLGTIHVLLNPVKEEGRNAGCHFSSDKFLFLFPREQLSV